MRILDTINLIRKKIAQNQVEDAFKLLADLRKERKVLDEVILQSSRYKSLLEEKRLGTVSVDNVRAIQNRLTSALLDFLNELEENEKARLKKDTFDIRKEYHKNLKTRKDATSKFIAGQRLIDIGQFFYDRVLALKKLKSLLVDERYRLISIVGRGGIGKTGLVSKVLCEIEKNQQMLLEKTINGIVFSSTRTNGISLERIFLDCSDLFSEKKKVRIISIWTDIKKEILKKIDFLLGELSQGNFIIVLDNFEDLLGHKNEIVDPNLLLFFERCLLTQSNVKLLVTTRKPINFPVELYKFDKRIILTEGLPVEESVKLLRELDLNKEFGVFEADKNILEEICSLVKGVPRALEIIISILANNPLLSLSDLANVYFDQELVVEKLIKDNYSGLDEVSQMILQASSVYSRPVPLSAIDFMLREFITIPAKARINFLIRSYALYLNRSSGEVFLHPADRDYIYHSIPQDGDFCKINLELIAAKYYNEISLSSDHWKDIFDIETKLHEFQHYVNADEIDMAARLLNKIDHNFLTLWGYSDRVLEMREKLTGKIKDKKLEALHHSYLGYTCYAACKYDMAIKNESYALELFEKDGNDEGGYFFNWEFGAHIS